MWGCVELGLVDAQLALVIISLLSVEANRLRYYVSEAAGQRTWIEGCIYNVRRVRPASRNDRRPHV